MYVHQPRVHPPIPPVRASSPTRWCARQPAAGLSGNAYAASVGVRRHGGVHGLRLRHSEGRDEPAGEEPGVRERRHPGQRRRAVAREEYVRVAAVLEQRVARIFFGGTFFLVLSAVSKFSRIPYKTSN